MQCRRIRRITLVVALGVVLVPAVLWVLIVLIAPTNWARRHVIAALEESTGRGVQLDDLDICLGGGISLANLRISSPRSTGDPWLQAERVEIDVSPLQLLRGRFEPSRLDVDGATLRVLRREDGSLELADLTPSEGGNKTSAADSSSEPHECGAFKLKAQLRRTNIVIADARTNTQMTFEGVHGEGALEADGALMISLSGLWNQGPFQLTAHLDHSLGRPSFDGQFMAREVVMDQGMSAIRYAVPVLAGAPMELKGRLGTNVYLSGRGRTAAEVCQSMAGRGTLSLDPIALNGTPLVAEFARIANQSTEEAVGSIKTDFVIKDRRIRTDNLTVNLGRLPVNVSGWTDFEGALDYQVKLDTLSNRIPERAREYLSGLDLNVDNLTSLHLTGTVDKVAIRPMGLSPDGRMAVERVIAPEDRQRLKVLGRQLRDKLLR